MVESTSVQCTNSPTDGCAQREVVSRSSSTTLGTTNHMICAASLDQLCNHMRTCAPRSIIIRCRLAANMKHEPSDR